MTSPKTIDYILLSILSLIWASAFFNIKIATYSYGPLTIAFLRIFLGAVLIVIMCVFKNIKIEAFSKDWYWFAVIGFVNLVIPFFLLVLINKFLLVKFEESSISRFFKKFAVFFE